jgi:nitrogen-specific signal transduction histidine kinase
MVFRDVSEQRRMQRQIELADRLASVGTMAAGMAHEVNEPMNLVVSNVQQVASRLQEHRAELHALFSDEAYAGVFKRLDDIQRALAEAEAGANRVTKIASELRTFAQPPTNHERPVDLRRVLSWAGEVVAHEIRSRAALAMEVGNVPLVIADEARLGQVFINLLLNAAQAIAPGHVKDNEVRVSARTSSDGRAVVEVRDSGCGIPPELLGRIFDPFFTTKPVGVGTGLGLAICRRIVTALGGSIGVESEPGRGTCFRVILPVSQALPAKEVPPPVAASRPIRAGRILVVDDEPMICAVVRRLLTGQHQVVVSSSVREALQTLNDDAAFDVILCDLMMPDMTGMDMHAALLATAPALAERLVFMTGGAFTAYGREFLNSIGNDRIEKPFDAQKLKAVIMKLVDRH